MRSILWLTVVFALAFTSSAAPLQARAVGVAVVRASVEGVEGVTIERQRLARLKPGYQFERVNTSSVAVLRASNAARILTGTLTCTKPGKNTCRVEIGGDTAKCNSSCYFVSSGGVLAQ